MYNFKLLEELLKVFKAYIDYYSPEGIDLDPYYLVAICHLHPRLLDKNEIEAFMKIYIAEKEWIKNYFEINKKQEELDEEKGEIRNFPSFKELGRWLRQKEIPGIYESYNNEGKWKMAARWATTHTRVKGKFPTFEQAYDGLKNASQY